MRDNCKRKKQWANYKMYRNKTKDLIRKAKRKHFCNSVTNFKDTKTIWKHLRTVNGGPTASTSMLPDELIVDNERFSTSESIASKLNEYFSSISELLNGNNTDTSSLDLTKLQNFVNDKSQMIYIFIFLSLQLSKFQVLSEPLIHRKQQALMA